MAVLGEGVPAPPLAVAARLSQVCAGCTANVDSLDCRKSALASQLTDSLDCRWSALAAQLTDSTGAKSPIIAFFIF